MTREFYAIKCSLLVVVWFFGHNLTGCRRHAGGLETVPEYLTSQSSQFRFDLYAALYFQRGMGAHSNDHILDPRFDKDFTFARGAFQQILDVFVLLGRTGGRHANDD